MQDTTVFISGANRGIGLGLVKAYLAAGAKVIAGARQPQQASEFALLSEQYPQHFHALSLDVNDPTSIASLANNLQASPTQLDIVINNAGANLDQNLGEWTQDGFEQCLRTNSVAPALVSQALLPLCKANAKIINLSSGMGSIELNINPLTGLDAYAMSKAALNMLCVRLAEKLKPQGICVVALSPGWVQTDMGGSEAPLSIADASSKLLQVITALSLADSGRFIEESGQGLPW